MKILLCVTGGIAAYKAIDLTSKLVQKNHEVKVIMTESALEFLTPLSFQALSRNEVHTDTFDETNPSVIKHIDLADWADINIVAPATASTIGKIANGIADNMVTTTLLASTKPTYIAPAMNSNMYANAAVIHNIETLKSRGYRMIEPNAGFLACGYIANGRMTEPMDIIARIETDMALNHRMHSEESPKFSLIGKKILITAGPTIESLDPVRYLTNRSSGKMGYALAKCALERGADVTLVSTQLPLEIPAGVQHIAIESAEDMFNAVKQHMDDQHVIIKAAAVADYTPVEVYNQKMKKKEGDFTIALKRTTDILKYLGEHKKGQILVGFAAETENVAMYAKGKLEKKNADVIIANNVGDKTIGFKSDDNQVTMYFKDESEVNIEKQPKDQVAELILMHLKEKGLM